MEQTIYYIICMSVSKFEWSKMTWRARIDTVCKELNISLCELARRLNVSPRTINYWKAHKKIPRDKYAKVLRSWCVTDPFDDIKEESYMALHTMSADASSRLLENASLTRDPMMLSMALHCIAIKLAALISHTNKNNNTLIIKFKALYGDTSTSLVVTDARFGDARRSVVTISVPSIGTSMFTIVVKQIVNIDTSSFAFTVSDKALLTCAKRINTHLSL